MNIKRILLISIVLVIIVSSLNMVSAGEDNETYITDCFVSATLDDNFDWYINIQVYSNSSENVKSYNLTTSPMYDEEFDFSLDGEVNITDGIKENETYTVSIYFPGDDKLRSMEYEETGNTTVDYSPVENEDSSNTVPSEDTQEDTYDEPTGGVDSQSDGPVVNRVDDPTPSIHGFFGTQGYKP